MSEVKLTLNREGVGELLHEVGAKICAEHAQNIAASCGPGYEHRVFNAGTRTIAIVYADSKEAKQDNLDNNTLLKAVGYGD